MQLGIAMRMTPTQQVELLRACCCIAAADGETSDEEVELLKKIARRFGGVGRASLEAMISRAESDPDFHRQQFDILRASPLECLDVLLQITVANGQIKENEFEILKSLAGKLAISEDDFQQRVQAAMQSTRDAD